MDEVARGALQRYSASVRPASADRVIATNGASSASTLSSTSCGEDRRVGAEKTEGYRVVAVDLDGHGESGAGRGDWNLPAFGDDVTAVVDAVGAHDVALVGHSMGGDAIVFAARKLGSRVRGLVWVDTFRSLGDEPTSSAADIAGFVAPFHADFGGAVDRFARGLFPEGAEPSLVDHVARSMAAAPQDATLGSIG